MTSPRYRTPRLRDTRLRFGTYNDNYHSVTEACTGACPLQLIGCPLKASEKTRCVIQSRKKQPCLLPF